MTMNMTVLFAYGLVAKLRLKRYQLPCQPVLAVSCCFTLETSAMQKARVKNFKTDPKINKNQRRKAWYVRHFRKKPYNKNKQQIEPETSSCSRKTHKNRCFRAFDQKCPKISDTPRAAADAATSLLLLLLLALLLLLWWWWWCGRGGGGRCRRRRRCCCCCRSQW